VRSTLFHIPHELFGIPVFGWGWLLGLWAVASGVVLVRQVRRHGWGNETWSLLPLLGLLGLAIGIVLPRLEELQHGVTLGLPIRGYGVMMLLAVTAGIALSVWRAQRVGLDPERIYALAFWMFLAAITGARLFYVVQYWRQFRRADGKLLATAGDVLNVAQGGLVVYGALAGGLIACLVFLRARRLPVLAVGDLIAPGMALGLAIGRLGCLLNGCCFGGTCDDPWAVTFPASSPPYAWQHRMGVLHGFQLGEDPQGRPVVGTVDPQGPAAAAGLAAGDEIASIDGMRVASLDEASAQLERAGTSLSLDTVDGQRLIVRIGQLPPRSRPVHPSQVYSSISAGLLCLLLLAWDRCRRRDGELLALLLTLYPLGRFGLELLRTDERGQFHTGLTIAQLISLGLLVLAAGLWFYVLRQGRGSVWDARGATARRPPDHAPAGGK